MKNNKQILIYILLIQLILYCKKTDNINNINSFEKKEEIIKKEDFNDFKSQFFKDSIFQIRRIFFPLRGNSTEYVFDETNLKDTITNEYLIKKNTFYWNKKGWVFLRSINLSKKDYLIEEKIDTNKVYIKIKSKYEDFTIYFEFDLIQNKWYLSYYSSEWY